MKQWVSHTSREIRRKSKMPCRWPIVAALRQSKFFSLEELNVAIRELLDKLNHRPFRKKDGSRATVWEAIDRPALKPLPMEPFDLSEWSRVGSTSTITLHSMRTSTACPRDDPVDPSQGPEAPSRRRRPASQQFLAPKADGLYSCFEHREFRQVRILL